MPRLDFVAHTHISRSSRVRQLEAMFDVPAATLSSVEWHANVPIEEKDWNVGLIVGPSGAGKSTAARELFGDHVDTPLTWKAKSVIDDFPKRFSMEVVSRICQAVGFNTIPAWMRPYRVLSTGERFRVELARRLLECADPVVVDEFTSVVDRQVAKIGAHAVQKYIRREKRQFVGVTCHYDVADWLQPDWTFEPAEGRFQWRSLRPRPRLGGEIARVDSSAWRLFAPFHYLTAGLHRNARCFVLFVDGQPAAFAGVLHQSHFLVRDIKSVSRMVTLPDWQGLGLAFVLLDALAAAYKAGGFRLHTHPAHPSLVRSFDHSPKWAMRKPPGKFLPARKTAGTGREFARDIRTQRRKGTLKGMRPCATFAYVGEAMDHAPARQLIGEWRTAVK